MGYILLAYSNFNICIFFGGLETFNKWNTFLSILCLCVLAGLADPHSAILSIFAYLEIYGGLEIFNKVKRFCQFCETPVRGIK